MNLNSEFNNNVNNLTARELIDNIESNNNNISIKNRILNLIKNPLFVISTFLFLGVGGIIGLNSQILLNQFNNKPVETSTPSIIPSYSPTYQPSKTYRPTWPWEFKIINN